MKRILWSMVIALLFFSYALAQTGGPVTFEGQVVCCEECWVKADRRTLPYGTRTDLQIAVQCVGNGDPTLLAVGNDEGGFTLYELRLGKYKRAGNNWLHYIGKHIAVTGVVGKNRDRAFIKVNTLSVVAEAAAAAEPEVNPVGSEAELVLKDLAGVEQRLSAFRGRIVVLNFWATYCPPCRKEMPDLTAIQNQYGAFGVQVIGAAADKADDKQKVTQFVRETKVNFPVWLGATGEDMLRFGLPPALPGTVIIGRDGKIVAIFRGVIQLKDLKSQVDALIAAAKESDQIAASKVKARKASVVPS